MNSRLLHSEIGFCIRAARIFLLTAVAILVMTGLAKLITSTGSARILERADPVFWFMTNRQLLLAVALLELVIAAALLTKRLHLMQQLGLLAWISSSFLIYRGARAWAGAHGPCGCLGNMTGALGISAGAADLGMKLMLGYLLAGSIGFLLLGLLTRGKPMHAEEQTVREKSVPNLSKSS